MGNAGDETHEAIMEATFRAVCQSGYAELTMQDIADEFEKSKSLLHYHYDTKEDLLAAFLEHLIDQFETRLVELADTDAPVEDRLREFIDWFTLDPDEQDRMSLHLALLEMRSQAQRNPRFQELFARSDRMGREAFAQLIEEGQSSSRFDTSVDAQAIARLCFAAMDGARARQLTTGEAGYARSVGETLYELVIDTLTDGPR